MFEKTHVQILKKAMSLLNFKELYRYKEQLKAGVISPDSYYRVFGHFYNPKTGKGIMFFGNAKDKGISAYEKAIECYKKGKKEKAYFLLGRAAHFLMDTTVPAHTIPVMHLFSTDDLEIYMLNNPPKHCKAKPARKEPESYFIDAAKESRKLKTLPNGILISLKFRYLGKKDRLSNKELKQQAGLVTKRAVSYSAGLMKKFCDSV